MPTAEQLRIGRQSTVTETPIAVAAVDGAFLGANANRISLTICPGAAGNVFLSTKNPAVIGQGVTIPALGEPVVMTLEQYGSLLAGPWRSIGSAGTTLTVFEESSTSGF